MDEDILVLVLDDDILSHDVLLDIISYVEDIDINVYSL